MTTWFITGCSSGLGHALASAVLEAGFNAVVTARDVTKIEATTSAFPHTALAVTLDVTNTASIGKALQEATERFGAIDVLVNNAGYGYRAAIEEGEDDAVDRLFATNFRGPVALIKAVLPKMRARRRGVIVNVSSIAAQRSGPGSGFYSASKMALEGVSDALRKEVGPLGIKVIVVEPGAFRTDFAGRSLTGTKSRIADYEETVGPRRKENDDSHGTQSGDPARAARTIIETVQREVPPFRLLLGSDAVEIVREEAGAHLCEIERWRAISEATDYFQDR